MNKLTKLFISKSYYTPLQNYIMNGNGKEKPFKGIYHDV